MRHVRRRHLEGMIEFESAQTRCKLIVQWKCCISLSKDQAAPKHGVLAQTRALVALEARYRDCQGWRRKI